MQIRLILTLNFSFQVVWMASMRADFQNARRIKLDFYIKYLLTYENSGQMQQSHLRAIHGSGMLLYL